MYQIVDFVSKKSVRPNSLVFCDGENPWEVLMDLSLIESRINIDFYRQTPPTISKYLPFLPIKDFSKFVSLNEGSTPLIQSKNIGKLLGVDLYFKPEFHNPTGSSKDRGSAVELSVARELGATAIAVASTGNMAASCSCYAAAANIPCFVFVPQDTPASKLSQVISFGGKIVQVRGDYNQAAELAERVALELGFYLAGDYAFRVEGQKTGAYEIADQLFYQVPEYIFIPIGCGTHLAGYVKGFQEYHSLGLIDRLPKIVGTQAEGANSIVQSFRANEDTPRTLHKVNTIASAIAISKPIDGVKALRGIKETNGFAEEVSDREILEAQYMLSREEGLFVEASAATTLAVLRKRIANGEKFDGKIVCVLTGDGLKDPSPILRMAVKPPTIPAKVEEFVSLYRRDFFSGRTVSYVDGRTILFESNPAINEIEVALKQSFDLSFPAPFIHRVQEGVNRFLIKGKKVSMTDFQDIVQDLFGNSTELKQSLKVVHFDVTTGMNIKPKAGVTVLLDGVELCAEAQGVGPVDAVIAALRLACHERLDFKLTDYNVVIRSQGTDAVVFAEMKLHHDAISSVGRGTSPDIIQASIEAFENAYNGLF